MLKILANFPANIAGVLRLRLARALAPQVAAGAAEATDTVTSAKRLVVREVESVVLHACIIAEAGIVIEVGDVHVYVPPGVLVGRYYSRKSDLVLRLLSIESGDPGRAVLLRNLTVLEDRIAPAPIRGAVFGHHVVPVDPAKALDKLVESHLVHGR